MKIIVLTLLSLIASMSLSAQETVEQQADDLKRAFSTPIVDWTPAFIQANFQKYIDLYIKQLIWDPDSQKRIGSHLPKNPPNVIVRVTDELRTPFAENGQIIFPVSYIAYLGNISTLVAHDLYGSDHYVHLGRPLLSTPFRTTSIIPLLSPLHRFVDTNGYQAIQYYIRCPEEDQKCAEVQASSVNALILFTLLHEISHQLFHHELAYEGVDLEKELAADQNAYLVLTKLTSDFTDPRGDKDITKEIRLAYRLSPIVWLEIEESRDGMGSVVAKARKQALLEKLTSQEHEQVDELLQPETETDSVARLTVLWNEEPDLLIVDGVNMPANDVKGKTLLVRSGLHSIVALRANEIAVSKFSIHSDKHVLLEFESFAVFDPATMLELERKEDWQDILSRTAGADLRPRSPSVGLYHWEALHRLGLDSLIHIDDWSSIPELKRRTYLRWQNNGTPLSSWYAGLAPGSP